MQLIRSTTFSSTPFQLHRVHQSLVLGPILFFSVHSWSSVADKALQSSPTRIRKRYSDKLVFWTSPGWLPYREYVCLRRLCVILLLLPFPLPFQIFLPFSFSFSFRFPFPHFPSFSFSLSFAISFFSLTLSHSFFSSPIPSPFPSFFLFFYPSPFPFPFRCMILL